MPHSQNKSKPPRHNNHLTLGGRCSSTDKDGTLASKSCALLVLSRIHNSLEHGATKYAKALLGYTGKEDWLTLRCSHLLDPSTKPRPSQVTNPAFIGYFVTSEVTDQGDLSQLPVFPSLTLFHRGPVERVNRDSECDHFKHEPQARSLRSRDAKSFSQTASFQPSKHPKQTQRPSKPQPRKPSNPRPKTQHQPGSRSHPTSIRLYPHPRSPPARTDSHGNSCSHTGCTIAASCRLQLEIGC